MRNTSQKSRNLLTIKEASAWASSFLKRSITTSNISYLVQYGRILKLGDNGITLIDKNELENYYKKNFKTKEDQWKKQLGEDLNWELSFSQFKESETTKHVHRLHPYKGKFIPQLVEYFLDSHTDNFKDNIFFSPGDTVLDPFCGSGTTLVQSNELGINAIGIDISAFNTLISNVKLGTYDMEDLKSTYRKITTTFEHFLQEKDHLKFEYELLDELKAFNNQHFPSPEFKYKVRQGLIDEKSYGQQRAIEFHLRFTLLIDKYNIELRQKLNTTFLDKWYLKVVREEIEFIFDLIKEIKNPMTKRLFSIILSRTIRSCRATTHSDLATLYEPVTSPYYCKKHGKICKPIFSILGWWKRYSKDTFKRICDFNNLRTYTYQKCLTGDSRRIDIFESLAKKNKDFTERLIKTKIDGIFSSPPYVGLIDYHEQHAYSYDLFGFNRQDELEIGPLFKGQGKEARLSYADGIAKVLANCKKYMKKDYNVFLVANDKYNLYPSIAEKADMQIVNRYKRPVLNRVEKDRNAYSEIIFHLKEK